MVHCEQMLPLGESPKVTETLRLVGDDTKGYSVSNTTDLVIRDVGVFRRVDPPYSAGQPQPARIEAAYIATIEPGRSAALQFKPLAVASDATKRDASTRYQDEDEDPTIRRRSTLLYPEDIWLDEWNKVAILAPEGKASESAAETNDAEVTRIRLHLLARLASSRLRLLPGDVRLIGWTDQRLPGVRIQPAAPQNRTYTLVLAHLVRGDLPAVRPDRNVAEDYLSPSFFDSDVPVEIPAEPETP
jgi:hypothetical protein